jgi:hypothetical protein
MTLALPDISQAAHRLMTGPDGTLRSIPRPWSAAL